MADILLKHNAVVVLAWLVFIGWGLLGYILGVLLLYCTALLRQRKLAHNLTSGCAWLLGNTLFALTGALLWEEVYEAYEEVESAPYLFGALLVYELALFGWLYACYVCTHWKVLAYACAGAAALAAALTAAAVYATLHSTHWYHHFALLLLVPPALACIGTHTTSRRLRRASGSSVGAPDAAALSPPLHWGADTTVASGDFSVPGRPLMHRYRQ